MNLDCISIDCDLPVTNSSQSEKFLERSERTVKIRPNALKIPEISDIYELKSIHLKKMTYTNEMVAVKTETFSGVAAKR